ncbi:hypothetical protein [Leptospira stimsonii]|uniref:hypothetical protein n=1 Tax=Leptospira stimsonii TaxID=2202203 RepID=UPI003CCFE324
MLLDWNDQIDPESETSEEPLIDSFGMKIPFQRFTDEVGWCIDLTAWKEFLLNQNSAIFNSKIKAYRGTVSCLDAQWDSGKKYLENISKTLSLLSKGKIEIIPPWRDADDQFHILDASGLSELADEIDLDLFNQGLVLYGKKWENENAIRDLSEYGQIDVLQMWESP